MGIYIVMITSMVKTLLKVSIILKLNMMVGILIEINNNSIGCGGGITVYVGIRFIFLYAHEHYGIYAVDIIGFYVRTFEHACTWLLFRLF